MKKISTMQVFGNEIFKEQKLTKRNAVQPFPSKVFLAIGSQVQCAVVACVAGRCNHTLLVLDARGGSLLCVNSW